MSVDRAYIFPHTLAEDGVVFPLSSLFSQLVMLRPVEDDLPEVDTPFLRLLASQPEGKDSLVNYACPAPLGKDRDAFLSLLRDIRSRPEDYAGHLSHLSAGAVPVVQKNEQEHSIIDTLLQQTGIRSKREEHTPEAKKEQGKNVSHHHLWQARMLLKLGESVDIQQVDIRNNLSRMSLQQDEVLRVLRKAGEDDEAFDAELATMIPDEEIPLEQQRLRLKAWSRLFALSEPSFEKTVFISQYSEAIEVLIEQYQQEFSCTVTPFLTLPLPLLCPEIFSEQAVRLDEFLAKRDAFQEEARTLLAPIRELGDGLFDSHCGGEIEEKWIDLLDSHYPITKYGRCTLTLYFLPEILPQKNFLETFAPQDKSKGKNKDSQRTGTGMLLGFLKRQENRKKKSEQDRIK